MNMVGPGSESPVTSDEAAMSSGGTASAARPLPFDTSVANQARVYDFLLG